jgi:hypothetical protein
MESKTVQVTELTDLQLGAMATQVQDEIVRQQSNYKALKEEMDRRVKETQKEQDGEQVQVSDG